MTLNEILARVDDETPNQYETALKAAWVEEIDRKILREIILAREEQNDGFRRELGRYNPENGEKIILILPDEFSGIYTHYLETKIHYHNAEMSKYNAAVSLFNTQYEEFRAWYFRSHRQTGKWRPRFGGAIE